ncbi:histidine kinase [Frankia sp. AiPs1]|uniref:sensor histidine kinase n=1 Tax=Frankia sp. AiPa1 TaxID=573492 RepID=UPI00202ADD17|nr:HAMP domain-containing sensor histidine kinase [Frankia sp. AiPa1]MCL9758847.1 HAMP domain-containing histidine kinase [Frankia sp. AiPa1]
MRRRLLIVLIAAGLAALAAFAVPLLYTTAGERTDRFVSRRTADINRFADLAMTGSDQLGPEIDAHAELYGDAVAVVDAAGHPLVRRGDLSDGPEVARAIDAALRNQRLATLPDLRPWSKGRVVFARPVGNGIEVSGAVVLLTSRDRAAAEVGRLWERVLFGVLAIAALFATLIVLLVRWVLRPITQLEHGLRAVGKGVHSAYVPPQQGPSEVRALLASFNRMADAVTESARRQRALIDDTSHQLRNPLMAMRLRMDTLADRVPTGAQDTYASMVAEAARLQTLLDGMRALAVADAAATELAAYPPSAVTCDAGVIVRDRIEFWSPAALTRGVSLRYRTPPESVPLRCTDTDLEQIVDVLIDNAIKYAPGSTVTVTVGARWPAARGRLTITDDGPGVSESELPHLTERFRRGRLDVRPGGPEITPGSGLGLAIAERLTTNHGGRLILSRMSPHGLSVAVDLPAGPRPAPSAPPGPSASTGPIGARPHRVDSIRADTTPTVVLPGMRRRRAHRRVASGPSTPPRLPGLAHPPASGPGSPEPAASPPPAPQLPAHQPPAHQPPAHQPPVADPPPPGGSNLPGLRRSNLPGLRESHLPGLPGTDRPRPGRSTGPRADTAGRGDGKEDQAGKDDQAGGDGPPGGDSATDGSRGPGA